MQIGAATTGFPLNTFLNVTGACGGGGCLNVQTGPEIGVGLDGAFDFGPGGSITLTGTVGSFTGVIFQGSFSPCTPQPSQSFCFFLGRLDQFGKLKVNPAVLRLLGISNASQFEHFISFFDLSSVSFVDGTYHASVSSGSGGGIATPEPGSMVLFATGLLLMAGAARAKLLH
jgi:hypothetical protein